MLLVIIYGKCSYFTLQLTTMSTLDMVVLSFEFYIVLHSNMYEERSPLWKGGSASFVIPLTCVRNKATTTIQQPLVSNY